MTCFYKAWKLDENVGWSYSDATITQIYNNSHSPEATLLEIAFDLEYDDGVVVKKIKKSMVRATGAKQTSWSENKCYTDCKIGDKVRGPHLTMLVQAFESASVTMPAAQRGGDKEASIKHEDKSCVERAFKWYQIFQKKFLAGSDPSNTSPTLRAGIVAVLASISGQKPDEDEEGVCALLQKLMTELDVWTVREYNTSFKRIPELEELTTTPFMIKIVTEILPKISGRAHLRHEIKSQLIFAVRSTKKACDSSTMTILAPITLLGRECYAYYLFSLHRDLHCS